MDTTLTLADAGLLIIGVFLLILIFYLILLTKNIIPVVKNANNILTQAGEVMEIVNQDVKSVQKLFDGMGGTVQTAVGKAQTSENLVKALTVVFSVVLALKKLMKR
ncbi:MAG TPA: hypothetical protein GX726_01705 [Clostridiales bacterium]|jgi:hypothetical protein|nr:hypothetical protein [Clostridiales bacterium]